MCKNGKRDSCPATLPALKVLNPVSIKITGTMGKTMASHCERPTW